MSKKLKIVAVSGGLQRPSRTLALVQEVIDRLGHALPVEAQVIELGEIAADIGPVTRRADLPASAAALVRDIEEADLIIAATPVYRASFTGLFKHLFDFVDHEALIDVPVLLVASGGSPRHALVIEHSLRPLFSFFQSLTLPIGIFATDSEFIDYRVADKALAQRINLAVERAVPWLKRRIAVQAAPSQPQALAA